MTEISRESALAYPTTYRIVQTFLYEGLIEQEEDRKRYRPTMMVRALSHGFQHPNRIVQIARPHIRSLTKRIGWPVTIANRVGRSVMLYDSTFADTALTFGQYYPGFTLPLLNSAAGKLSLAYTSELERSGIFRSMRVAQDADAPQLNAKQAKVLFSRIRGQGYAVQPNSRFNLKSFKEVGQTSSLAVPIFCGERFEAALTAVFFAKAIKMAAAVHQYLEELQSTARQIGLDLELKNDD